LKLPISSILYEDSEEAKENIDILLNEFQKINIFELEDGSNLSSILQYYATTIITAIEK
jgi:hypothetical protein